MNETQFCVFYDVFKVYFHISGLSLVDYSVRVSHLDRDEIKMKIGPSANEGYDTEVLRKSLAFHLKKKHPLHDQVGMLTNAQLFGLCVCDSLSLKVTRREKTKMAKLIVDHFFNNYPDAPLTNLQRIMEEDAYFDQLTSIVSFSYHILIFFNS